MFANFVVSRSPSCLIMLSWGDLLLVCQCCRVEISFLCRREISFLFTNVVMGRSSSRLSMLSRRDMFLFANVVIGRYLSCLPMFVIKRSPSCLPMLSWEGLLLVCQYHHEEISFLFANVSIGIFPSCLPMLS